MQKRSPFRVLSFALAVLILISPLQVCASAEERLFVDSSAAELLLESDEEEDSAALGESGHADDEELEAPAEPNAAQLPLPSPVPAAGGIAALAANIEANGLRYEIISEKGKTVMVVPPLYGSYTESDITIPGNISTKADAYTVIGIGPNAFRNCRSLKTITFEQPGNILSIRNGAFEGCVNITDFDFSKLPNLDLLGERAFFGSGIITADLSTLNLYEIAASTFANCANLESVMLPDSMEMIGDYAFSGCGALESITLPESIHTIGVRAFSRTALTEVDLSDLVEVLEDELFMDCERLREVDLPAGLKSIGSCVFSECPLLDTIYIDPGNTYFRVESGILFSFDKTVLYRFPMNGTTEYTVPDTVICIAPASFDHSKLSTITFSYDINEIGAYAFSGCNNLKTLVFQNTLPPSNIDYYAFFGSYIKNVYLPTNGEECISAYQLAFVNGCYLQSFEEANFVKKPDPDEEPPKEPEEEGVFRDTNGVRYQITSEKDKTVKVVSETNNPFTENNYLNLESITIPPTLRYLEQQYMVTEIGDNAFYGSKNLKSIELPPTIVRIGNEGFYGCLGLSGEMNLSHLDRLEEIGDSAFFGCDGITCVTLPDKVKSMGAYSFASCDNLVSITLSDALESIGESAFASCISLAGIILPDGLRSIPLGLFSGCTRLETVRLPGAVESIDFDNLFFNCVKLKALSLDPDNPYFTVLDGVLYNKDMTVLIKYPAGRPGGSFTIPDTVEGIHYDAFRHCVVLTELTVPASVEDIGAYAFASWDTLQSLIFLSETPPSCASTAFLRTKDHAFTIYVPTEECIPVYQKEFGGKLGGKTTFEPMSASGNGGGNGPGGNPGNGDGNDPGNGGGNDPGNGGGSNPGNGGNDPGTGNDPGSSDPGGMGGNGNTPADYTPPYTSSSGGSDSSSDSQNNSPANTTSATADFRSLQGQLNSAIAAANNTKSAVARLRIVNYTQISLDTLRQLTSEAQKSGKTCLINADSVRNAAVITRISFYAHEATKDLLLSGSLDSPAAVGTKALFERFFDNRVAVVSLAQQDGFGMTVFIAVKVDTAGFHTNTLNFYSYDRSKNTYDKITAPRAFIDANGYLWFSTGLAGDIIITDKPLVLRGSA